jgi:hypothetical protein
MGRHAKSGLLISRTQEWLILHEHAPQEYPLQIRRIAAHVPCSPTLFYDQEDPEIIAVMAKIEAAKRAARPAPRSRSGAVITAPISPEDPAVGAHAGSRTGARTEDASPSVAAQTTARPSLEDLRRQSAPDAEVRTLPDGVLAARIARLLSDTGWTMQRFLAYRKRTGSDDRKIAAESPLAMADLDVALGALHKHAETMRPLVSEYRRRLRSLPPDPSAPGSTPDNTPKPGEAP